MLVKITCAKCGTDGSISFTDPNYEGPYRCWKCRDLTTVKLQGFQVISSEPLSEEELQQQQEIDALKNRFRKKSDD